MKGLSITLCIGRYGGFYIKPNRKEYQFRICIGWVAFTVYFYDIEEKIKILLDIKERYISMVNKLTENIESQSPTIN